MKMMQENHSHRVCLGTVLHPAQRGFAYIFGTFQALQEKSVDDLIDLRNYGIRSINFGLESADENILGGLFGKKIDKGMVVEGIAKLTQAGIHYSVNAIAGVIDEETNKRHLEKTAEFLKEIGFEGKVFVPVYRPQGLRNNIRNSGFAAISEEETIKSIYEFRNLLGAGFDSETWPEILTQPIKVIPYPVVFF